MIKMKKMICIMLAGLFFIQMHGGQLVFAADPAAQKPPERLIVNGVGVDDFDGYYADLAWEYPSGFFVPEATGTWLNVYHQAVVKGYKAGGGTRVLKEGNISAGTGLTTYRMKNLSSGTIYYADMTAYYKYLNGTNTVTSTESPASSRVKFMTDINISAYSIGTNQIKIEWDDVWNTDGRINYRLYISDSSDFSNAAANYIEADDIGMDRPVQEDRTKGTLSYIHTVRDPGKVYYVKIVPVITDTTLRYYSAASKTVSVSSFILAKTTKVSSSSDGTIWRIDWSPVIVGLSNSDITVQYEVSKGRTDSSELPSRIQTVNNTSIYVVLNNGEEAVNYYIIRALVKNPDGSDVYPGIDIISDKIMMKETEVAATPPTPKLVNELGDVKYEVLPDKIKLLWQIPKKITGEIDYETFYDIWLNTDPDIINDDNKRGKPISWKLADGITEFSDGSVKYSFEYVKSGTNILGCSLTISGVSPNTSYYFRLQARKNYLGYVNDILTSIPYSSEPALKTIVTPTGGGINRPVAPTRPAFRVKEQPKGKKVISDTTATLQIKNKWYENLDTITNKWIYLPTELSSPGAPPPDGFPQGDEYLRDGVIFGVNINNFRMIEYDNSIRINVYYAKYDEAQNSEDHYSSPDISIYKPVEKRGFEVTPNDDYENPLLNYPDKKKHNVDIRLTGLEQNTTYVMWVKAERVTTGSAVEGSDLLSEASDPIFVTTLPGEQNPVEKPTVPVFNYNYAGDVYVDLGWNYDAKYKYYIKYGTTENPEAASQVLTVDMGDGSFYRISGLNKDTLYYFWIQAEYVNSEGKSEKSDWSDAYAVKTLPHVPPDTPLGFGIKTSPDAITVNSITYQWLQADGMEYILELAENSSFNDPKTFNAGSAAEYKVEGLLSNVRYYARLYAYNPDNKLRSVPTASVAVKTLKSKDDYDSDQDKEDVISGEYVIKDSAVIKGVWHIKIVGVNADRFIERVRTDKVLDYYLDAGKPPVKGARLSILISSRVFTALSQMKENLIIIADGSRFTIRPYVLTPEVLGNGIYKYENIDYEILIDSPGAPVSSSDRNLSFKTAAIGLSIKATGNGSSVTVEKLNAPVSISIPFTDKNWYKAGKTTPLRSDTDKNKWQLLNTASASYDADTGAGFLAFDALNPGAFAVADKGSYYFDDVYGSRYETSIINVMSACGLKSISGRLFKPEANIGTGDAVKMMMDVLGYQYGSSYMTSAVKAGIIQYEDSKNADKPVAREGVIAMAVRVYEIKSSEKAKPSGASNAGYTDMNKVSSALVQKVRYAAENGILPPAWSMLQPKANVTRGEVMYMLEKVLALTGDID